MIKLAGMKITGITTRLAKLNDLAEIQKMFVDTISTICNDDYSPEQIKVWTSSIKNTPRWTDKLSTQYFRIAEFDNKIVSGNFWRHDTLNRKKFNYKKTGKPKTEQSRQKK